MSNEFIKFRMPGGRPKKCRLVDAVGNTKDFPTITDAARFILDDTGNVEAAVVNISTAIKTGRKAYGFKWESIDE